MGGLRARLSILVVGIVLGAIVTNCAEAATFSGKSEICNNFAQNAVQVAQLRDAGVPWGQFEAWLRPQLDEAVADPTTYTKSREDVDYIIGVFKRIFDQPDLKLDAVASWTYTDCMKLTPASFKRRLSV